MAERVQKPPMMHFKPLTIDYEMYSHGLFSCNARIHLAIMFHQLLFISPFPKTSLVPKKIFTGLLGPQVIMKSPICSCM